LKIAIGSDHAGYALKEDLRKELTKDHDVLDMGTDSEDSVHYPDFARKVCQAVRGKDAEFGILVCGTGLGMAISANKFPGIRAIVCSDTFSARMGREHNDANVLCVGARVVGSGLAMDIVNAFLSGSFAGGRHSIRVQKIADIESEFGQRS
jgi:ribose 5-phosphate isomerase B